MKNLQIAKRTSSGSIVTHSPLKHTVSVLISDLLEVTLSPSKVWVGARTSAVSISEA